MPYETKEEILKLGEIDPELKEFLSKNELPKVNYDDIGFFKKMAEERYVQMKQMLGETPADVKKSETHYTTRDGAKNRVLVFQPAEAPASGSPLIVMIHGGGFCIGNPEGEEQSCRDLVQAFGATCLSISYRLAPEFPFPHAPNDCWDALNWAAKSYREFGADPSKGFIVGGTSAGGNLSAVLALQARDEGLPVPLTGQYLAIPAVGGGKLIPEKYQDRDFSMKQNADVPVLPVAAIDMFMRGYAPDTSDHKKYTVMAHPNGHKNLPKAFFQIDGMDPLRDEGLIYATVLDKDNGIPTRVEVYPGLPHGHWGFFPFLSSSKKFRIEQVEGFGWLLGREPDTKKVTTQLNPTTL